MIFPWKKSMKQDWKTTISFQLFLRKNCSKADSGFDVNKFSENPSKEIQDGRGHEQALGFRFSFF